MLRLPGHAHPPVTPPLEDATPPGPHQAQHFHIVGVYAPIEPPASTRTIETDEFYANLQLTVEFIRDKHPADPIYIAGDFNARVGNSPIPPYLSSVLGP